MVRGRAVGRRIAAGERSRLSYRRGGLGQALRRYGQIRAADIFVSRGQGLTRVLVRIWPGVCREHHHCSQLDELRILDVVGLGVGWCRLVSVLNWR